MMFSCFLPVGEKFFIKSVQHYQGRISDPALKDQATRFIYQEAMHAKEHSRLNELVRDAYPLARMVEAFGGFLLGLDERITPKSTQLAITCAIEHLTSVVADTTLRGQEYLRKSADPAFTQLWLWHAAEEIEHKAVCFDVYQHVVGTGFLAYLNRILAMLFVTLTFFIAVVAGAVMFKLGGKRANRADEAHKPQPRDAEAMQQPKRQGTKNLLQVIAELVPFKLYLSYYKRRFHPWDHDNSPLVEAWKQRYPDFGARPGS